MKKRKDLQRMSAAMMKVKSPLKNIEGDYKKEIATKRQKQINEQHPRDKQEKLKTPNKPKRNSFDVEEQKTLNSNIKPEINAKTRIYESFGNK